MIPKGRRQVNHRPQLQPARERPAACRRQARAEIRPLRATVTGHVYNTEPGTRTKAVRPHALPGVPFVLLA